ncbi:OB-fold protein [Flaviaesturariibacter amylovorans]|uniref:tRNA_anti-like n=1 Tax=Flaviaesturariibacter amylovorans TaxID=1084520 RepID=A0ABP8HCY7_9BACT
MKKIILTVIALAVAGGAIYGWREYNRTNADLSNAKAHYTQDATALIAAFEKDTAAANKQYVDKILAVSGPVKSIDAAGNPVVVFLGAADGMSSVRCSMDSAHAATYRSITAGSIVTIKGQCTGGEVSDMGLGTDVSLKNCVLVP